MSAGSNRDGLDGHLGQPFCRHGNLGSIEWFVNLAARRHAFIDLEDAGTRHQWRRSHGLNVIERRPVAASDNKHVAKPARRDHAELRAVHLEGSVRRHRHAVRDVGDRIGCRPRAAYRVHHPVCVSRWCRRRLERPQFTGARSRITRSVKVPPTSIPSVIMTGGRMVCREAGSSSVAPLRIAPFD